MDNLLLNSKIEKYSFRNTPKECISKKNIEAKRMNKRLKWADVSSQEFKNFIKSIKTNYKFTLQEKACTIWWGRVPSYKIQKHMEHWKYLIEAQYFKNARTFLKLWKINNMIDGNRVALFDREVPDTVWEWERDDSNINERFFSENISIQWKRKLLQPIQHSTLLRTDVSSERIINENQNVQYHFSSEWEKVKNSLINNDEILNNIVSKIRSIMTKNEAQKNRLIWLENTYRHLHSSIENKSSKLVSFDKDVEKKIDCAKHQSSSKVPYRDFGKIYDTEDKQLDHKTKIILIKD